MEVGDIVYLNKRGLFNNSRYDSTSILPSRLEKNTKYKISKDEDGILYRNYDYLCPEHRKLVDSLPENEE